MKNLKELMENFDRLSKLLGGKKVSSKARNIAYYIEKECEVCPRVNKCLFKKNHEMSEHYFEKTDGDAEKLTSEERKEMIDMIEKLQNLDSYIESMDCIHLERNKNKRLIQYDTHVMPSLVIGEVLDDEKYPGNFSISLDNLHKIIKTNDTTDFVLAKSDVAKYVDDNFDKFITDGDHEYREHIKNEIKKTMEGHFGN